MQLKGTVALVTGSSRGIGAGVAKALAAKGVKVGLAGRRTDKLQNLLEKIQLAGRNGFVIEMDVADKNSVQEGVKVLVTQFGKIDILVKQR